MERVSLLKPFKERKIKLQVLNQKSVCIWFTHDWACPAAQTAYILVNWLMSCSYYDTEILDGLILDQILRSHQSFRIFILIAWWWKFPLLPYQKGLMWFISHTRQLKVCSLHSWLSIYTVSWLLRYHPVKFTSNISHICSFGILLPIRTKENHLAGISLLLQSNICKCSTFSWCRAKLLQPRHNILPFWPSHAWAVDHIRLWIHSAHQQRRPNVWLEAKPQKADFNLSVLPVKIIYVKPVTGAKSL